MSKSIAIITARGGSKRIPRKNIRQFYGKPMIAYAIETAMAAKCFDEIMVSTDDREIADISRSYGAIVPFMRSSETSNDYATTRDVLAEVLGQYKKMDRNFDFTCCLYPCVPFLEESMLSKASEMLFNNTDVDCVYPVCRYSTPIERALQINNKGQLEFWNPDSLPLRSQDLVPKYFDTGQFYFFRNSSFERYNTLALEKTYPIEISSLYCQDIDSEDDWEIAEFKYSMLQSLRQCKDMMTD